MLKAKRVLLITNIPTPYRILLYDAINEKLKSRGIEFLVVFGGLGYSRRKWQIDMAEYKFPYKVLRGFPLSFLNIEKVTFPYLGLRKILIQNSPCVVVISGFSPATMQVCWQAWRGRLKYIIWASATSSQGSFWRKWQRKILVRQAKGCISYGSMARKYFISLGVPPEKARIALSTPDTKFFREQTELCQSKLSKTDKEVCRILSVGELSFGKGIDRLFHILAPLKEEKFILDIVGSGAEQENLEKLAEKLEITAQIHFHGYKQKENLPPFFSQANVFLFPTRADKWGMVLPEAMAAGLACVASDQAGAAEDMIEEGVNGFVRDFEKTKDVTNLVRRLIQDKPFAQKIGKNAASFISNNVSIEASASQFVKAICLFGEIDDGN